MRRSVRRYRETCPDTQYAAPRTGLRHISNRSRACRNGNWKMASRDWRRKATGSRAESPEFAGSETWERQPNPREYRRFSHTGKSNRRDRTGWLGWEDSNSRIQRSRLSSMADRKRRGNRRAIFIAEWTGLGASHSLAAQPGKISDRQTFRNEGKFGPHFKGRFWKRHCECGLHYAISGFGRTADIPAG